MKPTQQLFATHNKKLLSDIIEKDEPVECDSFSDAKDENFDKPLKDVEWKQTN